MTPATFAAIAHGGPAPRIADGRATPHGTAAARKAEAPQVYSLAQLAANSDDLGAYGNADRWREKQQHRYGQRAARKARNARKARRGYR